MKGFTLSGKAKWMIVLSIILTGSHFISSAQQYHIQLKTMKVRLYAGYVNLIELNVLRQNDTSTYIFHAQARGATLDYDARGRLQVLPFTREGEIRIYLEKDGRFYNVNGVLKFESVKAPKDDAAFITSMGITAEDEKNRIKSPKKFILPPGTVALESNFQLDGTTLAELRTDELNKVLVAVLKRSGQYMVPEDGDIQLSSKEARIKKIDSNSFYVTPLQGQKRCKITVSLNGEKVGDEMVSVWTPLNVD